MGLQSTFYQDRAYGGNLGPFVTQKGIQRPEMKTTNRREGVMPTSIVTEVSGTLILEWMNTRESTWIDVEVTGHRSNQAHSTRSSAYRLIYLNQNGFGDVGT